MAPTTLVTFLVRTPPSTRSVHLFGSWDNFSAAYPMQRDTRTGPEHWSGCHSFSNIICDGDLQSPSPSPSTPREGGLKMGGTYWYYYKLDDDLEFHNSAEPATTSCPLLPGQIVNVLNVPFALSSSTRSRNDSVSSTSSDYHHTMEPTDKFLNPRPAPAKPPVLRLKTSPSLIQHSWSSASSPASASSLASRRGRSVSSSKGSSQPASANTLRVIRLTKKPSIEDRSRSASRSSNRSIGIIGAFRALKSPRIASPDELSDRGHPTPVEPTLAEDMMPTPKKSGSGHIAAITEEVDVTSSAPVLGLALRREFEEGPGGSTMMKMSSFGHHRRQRSSSHDPSPLHNSISREASAEQRPIDQKKPVQHLPLETLTEVTSTSNTPLWPLTAMKVEGENRVDEGQAPPDLEKRLPTLPNTPSSAYPPSIMGDAGKRDSYVENLQSRFSNTTVGTASYTNSHIQNDRSRFSEWTDCTTKASPRSEYESILDFEPTSPSTDADFEFEDDKAIKDNLGLKYDPDRREHPASKPNGLPSAISFSTVSSVTSSATPSSHVDLDSATDANFSWDKFQHYSLPSEEVGSGVTIKPASKVNNVAPLVVGEHHRAAAFPPPMAVFDGPPIPHSTSMKQLLDELSYLSGMIQHN